jgi:hypothetical protein
MGLFSPSLPTAAKTEKLLAFFVVGALIAGVVLVRLPREVGAGGLDRRHEGDAAVGVDGGLFKIRIHFHGGNEGILPIRFFIISVSDLKDPSVGSDDPI